MLNSVYSLTCSRLQYIPEFVQYSRKQRKNQLNNQRENRITQTFKLKFLHELLYCITKNQQVGFTDPDRTISSEVPLNSDPDQSGENLSKKAALPKQFKLQNNYDIEKISHFHICLHLEVADPDPPPEAFQTAHLNADTDPKYCTVTD